MPYLCFLYPISTIFLKDDQVSVTVLPEGIMTNSIILAIGIIAVAFMVYVFISFSRDSRKKKHSRW